jgi:hypothetical protein
LKAFRGYVQGYNAQAVGTEQHIMIAAEVNSDSPRSGWTSGTSRSVPGLTTLARPDDANPRDRGPPQRQNVHFHRASTEHTRASPAVA